MTTPRIVGFVRSPSDVYEARRAGVATYHAAKATDSPGVFRALCGTYRPVAGDVIRRTKPADARVCAICRRSRAWIAATKATSHTAPFVQRSASVTVTDDIIEGKPDA